MRFVPPKPPSPFGASGQPSFPQPPPQPGWGCPTGHWARAMEEAGDTTNPKPGRDGPRTSPPSRALAGCVASP